MTQNDRVGRPVAVVTGGCQGLGLAAASALATAGFDVGILDIQPLSDDAAKELAARGARFTSAIFDLADLAGHEAAIDRIEDELGPIDCLVDNAGIAARPLTDILDLGVEAFDRAVDVNLRGTFFFTQAVARRMVARTSEAYRSVIIVTSIAAELANTDRSQYCVTKAGLSMTAKLFAVRLAGAGIHVHEVRPGLITTAMTASSGSTKGDQSITSGKVPIARWGRPDDVGQTIATLASGALPYSTGAAIWVAGGLQIQTAP